MDFGSITVPTAVASLIGAALVGVIAYLRGRRKKARNAAIDFETVFREFLREELDLGGITPPQAEIDRADLHQALEDTLEGYDRDDDSPIDVRCWDGRYFAPTPQAVEQLAVVGSVLGILQYRPARFDCEDFAKSAWGVIPLVFGTNAVAIVNDTSAGHAYNVIVDSEGGVHLFEPNGGAFVELGETREDVTYSLEHGELTF